LEAVQRAIRTESDELAGLARVRLQTARDSRNPASGSGRAEREPCGIDWAGHASRGAELVELRVEAQDAPSAALRAVGGRVGDDRRVHPTAAEHGLAAVLARCANVLEAREGRNVRSGIEESGDTSRVHIDAHDRGCRVVVREVDHAWLRREQGNEAITADARVGQRAREMGLVSASSLTRRVHRPKRRGREIRSARGGRGRRRAATCAGLYNKTKPDQQPPNTKDGPNDKQRVSQRVTAVLRNGTRRTEAREIEGSARQVAAATRRVRTSRE